MIATVWEDDASDDGTTIIVVNTATSATEPDTIRMAEAEWEALDLEVALEACSEAGEARPKFTPPGERHDIPFERAWANEPPAGKDRVKNRPEQKASTYG